MAELDKETEVLLVAYYRSLGMSPKQIEALHNWSQATISRRLNQAKKAGYLQETVTFTPGKDIDKIEDFFPNSAQEDAIESHFGKEHLLRKVIIVPTPTATAPKDERTKRVGRAAAIYLANVLKDHYVVGVSFGRTLRDVVMGFSEPYNVAVRPSREGVMFVPLVGGLSVLPERSGSQRDVFECAASSLAIQLARVFLGESAATGQISLPTPAFVPTIFLADTPPKDWDDRINVARQFVKSIPEYRQIFGIGEARNRDPGALIGQMDIMLTSVGGLLDPTASSQPGTQSSEAGWMSTSGPVTTEEYAQLASEGVVGDIAGHFITDSEVTEFGKDSIITKVNRRVFGASPRDFQVCAQRTYENDRPGVVMVASTANKAKAVVSAINKGCVSTLIIDQELADAMESLVPLLKTTRLKTQREHERDRKLGRATLHVA
jgi:DNA-binding transcriptional regulator LsrR (DeoR family)